MLHVTAGDTTVGTRGSSHGGDVRQCTVSGFGMRRDTSRLPPSRRGLVRPIPRAASEQPSGEKGPGAALRSREPLRRGRGVDRGLPRAGLPRADPRQARAAVASVVRGGQQGQRAVPQPGRVHRGAPRDARGRMAVAGRRRG